VTPFKGVVMKGKRSRGLSICMRHAL